MAKLIYFASPSLDGFVADENGDFDWAAPDEEAHAFVNDLVRPLGTHLYGRRMYEVMTYWETAHEIPDSDEVELDFARVWQAADKVVYSTTLQDVASARTRIERNFDPAALAAAKATADRDMSIGGPTLAAEALKAGLVDELHLLVVPYVAGGGTPVLPAGLRTRLELKDERSFGNGSVYLRYVVGT